MEAVNCKLSIITINLDNKDGLQKTIESVVSQTFKNFEWIIIDGGSTDGSKELIAQYSTQLSYWVSEPDNGLYNAMNKGIKVSNGEYLLFLNSGDYLYNNEVLQRIIPMLHGDDLYVGQELLDNGEVLYMDVDDMNELYNLMIPHQSTFINRKAFDVYGLYDERKRIVADWCLFFRMLIIGNATIKNIPFIVSVFDTSGISSANKDDMCSVEKSEFLEDFPAVNYLMKFYRKNIEIVEALRASRLVFLLFNVLCFGNTKYNDCNIYSSIDIVLAEQPRVNYLIDFYRENYKTVYAIKSSRVLYFVFRIYFYIYRKFNRN